MKKIGGIKKVTGLCLGTAVALSLAGTSLAAPFLNRMGNMSNHTGNVDALHVLNASQEDEYYLAATNGSWGDEYAAFVKLDKDGNPVMGKILDVQGSRGAGVEKTSDGNFLFLATTPTGSWVGIIAPDGSLLRQTAFGATFRSAKVIGDNVYLHGGDLDFLELDTDTLSYITSADFAVDSAGADDSTLVADANNNLYISGRKSSPNDGPFVLKVDQYLGNPVMAHLTNTLGDLFGEGMNVTPAGEVLLVGDFRLYGQDYNGWVAKLSNNLTKVYEYTFDNLGGGFEYCASIANLAGTAFHVVGCETDTILPNQKITPVAVKIEDRPNSTIRISWQRGIAVPDSWDHRGAILAMADGGTMITSSTNGSWNGEFITLVRTDGTGNVPATGANGAMANPYVVNTSWTLSQRNSSVDYVQVGSAVEFDPGQTASTETISDLVNSGFDRMAN